MAKCVVHGGTPVKKCSFEDCQNNAKQGGKCKKHGANCTIKRCNFSKCNKFAQRGGACVKHGKELAAARAHAEATAKATEETGAVAPAPIAPALPPVAALPPLAVNNDDIENAELSQILCPEIVNDNSSVPAVAAAVANNNGIMEDGNVQPPSVAMPEVAATNISAQDNTNLTKKRVWSKRERKRCVVEGCNKVARGKMAKCVAHGGTPVKKYSFEDCQNNAKQGGKCKRHGAQLNEKPRICIFPDCSNMVRRNGVCVRHGAKLKSCTAPGCNNNAVRRTLCIKHGANSIGPELPGARQYKIARKDDDAIV